MRTITLTSGVALALLGFTYGRDAVAQEFSYNPPGVLVPGSGEGRMDDKAYAPDMRFPIQSAPAFANSQVWGIGGSQGPAGSSCSEGNFSYPWSDNYCETRTWEMPLCPSGDGHQGQDIRGATCEADVHPVVASEAGTVTNIGSYSVYITAADGTRYDYLHMGSVAVSVGEDVTKGQLIGNVSNEFGGTPTTVHLHFNLRQNVAGVGTVYVPPYMSLVNSYQALVGPPAEPPSGVLASVTCDALLGFVEPTDGSAGDVRFYFDGSLGTARPSDIPSSAISTSRRVVTPAVLVRRPRVPSGSRCPLLSRSSTEPLTPCRRSAVTGRPRSARSTRARRTSRARSRCRTESVAR